MNVSTFLPMGREKNSRPTKFQTLALCALILIAFALRFYRLAAQDIWGDEAFSIFLSSQPLAQVIAGGADTHPPFYPFLLFIWLRIVGDSAFATRALSALIGVLIVPLVFVLGKKIANARVAWFAAIFSAVSPLLIYYSQETRMYELVTVLALGSTYFAIHFQPNERNNISPAPPLPRSRAYFAITLLALYTHYSAFYVWLAENIFVLWRHLSLRAARSAAKQSPNFVNAIASSRKPLPSLHSGQALAMTDPARPWIILQFGIVAAYVPWIIAQSNFLSAKSSARFDEWSWRGVEIVFGKTLASFSAGLTLDPPLSILLIFGFGILVLVGLIIALRDHSAARLAPLAFFIPVLIAFIVNPILPFFFERYVLVALPAFYLTAALGLDFLSRRRASFAILATVALVTITLVSLQQYYFNDAYAKGKYGAMMTFVSAHAQNGDALVLNNPLQKPLYLIYAPRDIPAYFLPEDAPLEDPSTRAELEKIARDSSRVWLVQFGNPREYDPTNYLPRWLGANAYKSYAHGFVDAALSLYLAPRDPPAFKPIRAKFGETIELAAYALDRDQIAPRQDLRVTLQWRALSRVEKSSKVFVHLIGGYNSATESPVWAQMDGEPVGGTRATTQWEIGEMIDDRYGLLIPENIPSGEYLIEVGMYDPTTGARLAVTDAQGNRVADDRVILATVKVIAR